MWVMGIMYPVAYLGFLLEREIIKILSTPNVAFYYLYSTEY
jgi:hypothetical protein